VLRSEAEALNLSEFDYELPEDLIAQRPLERREDLGCWSSIGRAALEDRRFVEFRAFCGG